MPTKLYNHRRYQIAIIVFVAALMGLIAFFYYHATRIDESGYVGLTVAEAKDRADRDEILVKYAEIDGNKSVPNFDIGSCKGYIFLSINDEVVTDARYERSMIDC